MALIVRNELFSKEATRRFDEIKYHGHLVYADCLAQAYIKSGDYNTAVDIYENAIEKSPNKFWLWHNFCRLHITRNDIDGAIEFCRRGIVQYPDDLSPVIHLTNLFAAKGEYRAAIDIFEDLLPTTPYVEERLQSLLKQLTDGSVHVGEEIVNL